MTPEQPDMFEPGRTRRDEGIKRVLEHVDTQWQEAYLATVSRWFEQLPYGATFTGEDLRRHAQPIIGRPHHHNAWGGAASAVLRDWLRLHRIVRCGLRQAVTARAHARSYPLYRKEGYT